jgi:excisionase family DNA binding protein
MLCSKIEIMNTAAIPECQTLDVKASATELGVCEETIRRLVRRKVIRKLPGLRRVLIPRSEIHRYLNGGSQPRFL